MPKRKKPKFLSKISAHEALMGAVTAIRDVADACDALDHYELTTLYDAASDVQGVAEDLK